MLFLEEAKQAEEEKQAETPEGASAVFLRSLPFLFFVAARANPRQLADNIGVCKHPVRLPMFPEPSRNFAPAA
jgi:hypothetical protein